MGHKINKTAGSFFRNRKVGTKIGTGYAIVGLVLAVAVGTTIWQVKRTSTVTNRTIDMRVPTAQASSGMMNGMNHSLAALRGWIILGKDKFKDERQIAWDAEIGQSLETMQGFAVNWTDPKNKERLAIIEEKLEDFKRYQNEIENIAQTIDNTPATKVLFSEATPKANVLGTQITRMIDLEASLASTQERKALLGMMADVRGSLGLGLGAIRAYLLSGDEKFKETFVGLWAKNTKRFEDLSSQQHLFTPDQQTAFDLFSIARTEFSPLPPRMFEIRSSDEWNLANRWLGTKAAPTAFEIKAALDGMVASQKTLLANDMEQAKGLTSALMTIEWILLGAGLAICTVLGILITRAMTVPLRKAVDLAKTIADGDLTQQLTINSRDELGELGEALNLMSSNLKSIVENITDNSDKITNSADELTQTAAELSTGAQDTTEKSASVAAAAEEMSINMTNMAASTEQMTDNVKSVASAVEEMTASVTEIARNAEQASQVAGEAAGLAETSNTTIGELGESADEIGKVIGTIQDIAEQTNLLALNATIEAARAGDAGKGFAVVATEVKELAKQTADATEDIRTRIEGIQSSTGAAVESIGRISEVIGQVNDVSKTIASAVEEQSITTKEIAQNIAQTATVAEAVSTGVGDSASAAKEITTNITAVDTSAALASKGAQRTHVSGEQLTSLSSQIRFSLSKFATNANDTHKVERIELPTSVPEPIRASFDRVQGKNVFDAFYDQFVNSDPQIAVYFMKTDFATQKALLRDGVALALRFANGDTSAKEKVAGLGESHRRTQMNIKPEMYPLWLDAWMKTVSRLDPEWNQQLDSRWRGQLQPVIDAMKSKYDG
jgi:methyl-accepting chemotaxis protein